MLCRLSYPGSSGRAEGGGPAGKDRARTAGPPRPRRQSLAVCDRARRTGARWKAPGTAGTVAPMTSRSRRAPRLAAALAAASLVVALPACGAVDKIVSDVSTAAVGLGVDLISKPLQSEVRSQLKSQGIELKSGPDCSGDIKSEVRIDCTAVTSDGKAVEVKFTAKANGSSSCPGSLVVTVGGKKTVNQSQDPCKAASSLN